MLISSIYNLNMLDDKDVQKLKEILVTKKDMTEITVNLLTRDEFDGFRTEVREEFANLRELFQTLITSVDRLAKLVEDMHQEYLALTVKVDRHEKWIQQIAQKLGIKLEY